MSARFLSRCSSFALVVGRRRAVRRQASAVRRRAGGRSLPGARVDSRADPERGVRRAGAAPRAVPAGEPRPPGGGVPGPVLRDHLHPRHGEAVRPVGRAGRLLPDAATTWDAEEGDLWLVQPTEGEDREHHDGADRAGAGQQVSADVEAEVVYVGQGREADYAGKDVKGKIVLGSGSVGTVFCGAVAARRRRRARHGQPRRQRRRRRRHARPDRLGEHLAGGRPRAASGSRCRCGSSSSCATCSSAGRRS